MKFLIKQDLVTLAKPSTNVPVMTKGQEHNRVFWRWDFFSLF